MYLLGVLFWEYFFRCFLKRGCCTVDRQGDASCQVHAPTAEARHRGTPLRAATTAERGRRDPVSGAAHQGKGRRCDTGLSTIEVSVVISMPGSTVCLKKLEAFSTIAVSVVISMSGSTVGLKKLETLFQQQNAEARVDLMSQGANCPCRCCLPQRLLPWASICQHALLSSQQ